MYTFWGTPRPFCILFGVHPSVFCILFGVQFKNFGHATDREAVALIISEMRVQVVAKEGEEAGRGSRGGRRGPEVATAGNVDDRARVEQETTGEWD